LAGGISSLAATSIAAPLAAVPYAAPLAAASIAAPLTAVPYAAPLAAASIAAPLAAAPIAAPLVTQSKYHIQDAIGQASYGHAEPLQTHNAIQVSIQLKKKITTKFLHGKNILSPQKKNHF
jgi:hypothetical protein